MKSLREIKPEVSGLRNPPTEGSQGLVGVVSLKLLTTKTNTLLTSDAPPAFFKINLSFLRATFFLGTQNSLFVNPKGSSPISFPL